MMESVWLVDPETKNLVSPYEVNPKCKKLKAAQPFTVSILSAVVAEDLDGFLQGNNDVLILSKSSLGSQPLVERIHCFEEEIPTGRPIKNILADNIFITDDFNGDDRLWLELHVLEVDRHKASERKAMTQSFQGLATTAGAIFPAILPYAFGASAIAALADKLVSALEKDTSVVKVPFALYPDAPRFGRAVMQTGTYVAFSQMKDNSSYKLQQNGLLTTGNKPSDSSYIVFQVAPIKQACPEFVTNQKLATLLTQMKNGNPSTPAATIDFLMNTLTQYDNFIKLNRYIDLKNKGADISTEEKTLLKTIEKIEALKPFLPK